MLDRLIALHACDPGKDYFFAERAKGKSYQEIWDECTNVSWMRWLAYYMGGVLAKTPDEVRIQIPSLRNADWAAGAYTWLGRLILHKGYPALLEYYLDQVFNGVSDETFLVELENQKWRNWLIQEGYIHAGKD